MAQITKDISVDVAKRNLFQAIVAKQFDSQSRFLRVTFLEEGEKITIESSSSILINAERADGNAKAFAGSVNEDGTVTVPLASWMLELDDIVRCDITIIDSESRKLTSTSFTLDVEAAAYSGEDVSQDENYDILITLLGEVADAKLAAETATGNATTAASLATNSANNADDATVEAQIATGEATSATTAALSATANANTAATAANTATTNAEAATVAANTAADRAEQAASAIFDELTANDTSYDNTISGLNGETVQEAIDELSSSLDNLAGVTLKDVTSWAKVQEIVRAGLADKVFNIGDQFTVMKGTTPLVFDVIGIDHDIPTDSTKTHSMTLQLHDCLMNLQFDAPEPTNPDTNRASYGSNNWLESALRQWLNASGDAGDWWSAKTEHDVAPAYATTTAGFLSDIDSEFLSVIGNVKKITTQNTVTDGGGSVDSDEKIFLLSRSEVYGGNENSINEGMAYPYYSDNSSLSSAGTGADVNRIKYLSGGVARHWWLRSPYASHASSVRYVYTGGTIHRGPANSSSGVAPACCII